MRFRNALNVSVELIPTTQYRTLFRVITCGLPFGEHLHPPPKKTHTHISARVRAPARQTKPRGDEMIYEMIYVSIPLHQTARPMQPTNSGTTAHLSGKRRMTQLKAGTKITSKRQHAGLKGAGDRLPDLDRDVERGGRRLCRHRLWVVSLLLVLLVLMGLVVRARVGRWEAPVGGLGVVIEVVGFPGGRVDLGAPSLPGPTPMESAVSPQHRHTTFTTSPTHRNTTNTGSSRNGALTPLLLKGQSVDNTATAPKPHHHHTTNTGRKFSRQHRHNTATTPTHHQLRQRFSGFGGLETQ